MQRPFPTSGRRTGRVVAAMLTAAAFAVGSLTVMAPAAAAVELPDVIPSIDGWTSTSGSFTAADDLAISVVTPNERLTSIAELTRDELATEYAAAQVGTGTAGPGGVELRLEVDREDLGEEGYELTVGESVTITAAEPAGIFYGTRTLVQMLTQQDTVPQGSVIDVPEYGERGVTVCACVINISTEFIDRLIEEMGFLKLNTMLLELKVKVEGHPETNTWSYYTKEDIAALVAKAAEHGIEVIPEINSPGHMAIWLENKPELQLTNVETARKDEVRMDITKDASFEFYTDLIDEYFDVFTTKYWHMGVDEYMIGTGYANFPQIQAFATEQFGAGATPNDVVAWYVNKVNDYVKGQGKVLRIWNDGVMTTNKFVTFDTDIIVEHWNQAGSNVRPQQFLDWGHQVANISNSLYMVRGSYGVNSRNLYNTKWTPEVFYGQTVTSRVDQILGARMSIWPDGGTPNEAENVTEERMFEPLRFVAQATWAGTHPWATFDEFRGAMDTIGRAPLWDEVERQPIPNGSFSISGANGEGALAAGPDGSVVIGDSADALTFIRTNDNYYLIKASDGRCLDLSRTGTMRLDVPVEIGADITLAECVTTTLQKWEVREVDGGFTIKNAASQLYISVSEGLVDVPVAGAGFETVPDGRVVQTPADWGKTVWSITGEVALTATPDAFSTAPGETTEIAVGVQNMSGDVVEGAHLRVAELTAGWTALPARVELDRLEVGADADATFVLRNINAVSGNTSAVIELVGADGTVHARTTVQTASVCSADTFRPTAVTGVTSEQLTGEPAPNGPGAAAIDGNPATYWHSKWSAPVATYPHAIVVDLGAEQSVCGLWYTGRASSANGEANGRIGNYEVYTSSTVNTVNGDWGAAVASGAFANVGTAQLAEFPARDARFIKLVALTEVKGNPWATIGELAAAGPAAVAPEFEAEVEAPSAPVQAGGDITVSASGFAPGELVSVELLAASPARAMRAVAAAAEPLVAQADADGALTVSVPVPATLAAGTYRLVLTGLTSAAVVEAPVDITAAPVDPTDPTTPVDPTDPTTPVDPTDPTTPVDPTDPTTPVDPTDPTTPVDPTDPTTPVDPTDPTTPVDPTDPTAPVDPTDPTTPVDPTDPTAPVDPTEPTEPAAPGAGQGTAPGTGSGNAPATDGAGSASNDDRGLAATGVEVGAGIATGIALLLAGLGVWAFARRRAAAQN